MEEGWDFSNGPLSIMRRCEWPTGQGIHKPDLQEAGGGVPDAGGQDLVS